MMMSMRRLTSAWNVNFSAPSLGANTLVSSLGIHKSVESFQRLQEPEVMLIKSGQSTCTLQVWWIRLGKVLTLQLAPPLRRGIATNLHRQALAINEHRQSFSFLSVQMYIL